MNTFIKCFILSVLVASLVVYSVVYFRGSDSSNSTGHDVIVAKAARPRPETGATGTQVALKPSPDPIAELKALAAEKGWWYKIFCTDSEFRSEPPPKDRLYQATVFDHDPEGWPNYIGGWYAARGASQQEAAINLLNDLRNGKWYVQETKAKRSPPHCERMISGGPKAHK